MENIKNMIQERYGKIAAEGRGCGSSCGCSDASMADEYTGLAELDIANLGLGCGIPTEFADIREGMTVLDLGSGAGIDVFIASKHAGVSGKVIGIDMTQQMIDRARANAESLGIRNVEFRLGEIEQMPVESNSVDRVISNCVLNLVPEKRKAFAEIYRVLKPGGAFIISDIVMNGTMPDELRDDAAMWAECVSGAIGKNEYLAIIREAGFKNIQFLKERTYQDFSKDDFTLLSMTVKGVK
ncbi:MAG: arsenite methyltransferase [Ignavibacteriae bacterium]|nr:arsenite methyltransferase [Ignavibacteriota bacterium]